MSKSTCFDRAIIFLVSSSMYFYMVIRVRERFYGLEIWINRRRHDRALTNVFGCLNFLRRINRKTFSTISVKTYWEHGSTDSVSGEQESKKKGFDTALSRDSLASRRQKSLFQGGTNDDYVPESCIHSMVFDSCFLLFVNFFLLRSVYIPY